MRKIPTLFERSQVSKLVVDIRTPGLEWFWSGEGHATRKWDGIPCLVKDGKLYKRYLFDTRRTTKLRSDFVGCGDPDYVTGQWPGWVPVGDGPEDIWFYSAPMPQLDGTYELCGPNIRKNAEELPRHVFVFHGAHVIHNVPRDYDALWNYIRSTPFEGIVWYRDNGVDFCKLKKSDFGFARV